MRDVERDIVIKLMVIILFCMGCTTGLLCELRQITLPFENPLSTIE